MSAAQQLEQRLRAEGRTEDACCIQRLRVTAAAQRGTMQVLYRDNCDLRRQIGLPTAPDPAENTPVEDTP
jgi:hypothetical protein